MTLAAPTRLATAAARAGAQLRAAAPGLVGAFTEALPRASDVVSRRLVGALYREGLADLGTRARAGAAVRLPGGPVAARWYGFDRVEVTGQLATDPVELLAEVTGETGPLADELADAVVNLAIAYARRPDQPAGAALTSAAGLGPDDQIAALERLGVDGHNLHPCGRTRLGWAAGDVLDHDLESDATAVAFVAVRRQAHLGHDVGALLAAGHPGLRTADQDTVVQPVHAWQLRSVVTSRYADLIADGTLRPLDVAPMPATPTAALRTVLLPPGVDGVRRYLKLSLDIQVTSTRRTISVASTHNGPVLSRLLHRLLASEPATAPDQPGAAGVLLMAETAGAAVTAGSGRDRDLAAIVRTGLDGRLSPGEIAVPGTALVPLLATLIDRYATSRAVPVGPAAALGFLGEYARVLLPPLLRLATRYGVALEAHLQNSVPIFRAGVPTRLALRDFAGLRLHRPRLAAAVGRVGLWPGSVVATDEVDVMRAKLGYTAFQAHLAELVIGLVDGHGVDERSAWRAVREVVDEAYQPMLADPGTAARARADHAFFTAPTVPHKALVRMRLAGGGDVYVPVRNPIAGG